MGDMASPLLLAVRASLFVDQINHRLLRAAGGVQDHLHGAKEAAAVVALIHAGIISFPTPSQ